MKWIKVEKPFIGTGNDCRKVLLYFGNRPKEIQSIFGENEIGSLDEATYLRYKYRTEFRKHPEYNMPTHYCEIINPK